MKESAKNLGAGNPVQNRKQGKICVQKMKEEFEPVDRRIFLVNSEKTKNNNYITQLETSSDAQILIQYLFYDGISKVPSITNE